MQGTLGALIRRHAQEGRLEWIGLRSERRGGVTSVAEAFVDSDGLRGDHARPGKRAVTLIQSEHLPVIGSMLGRGAIAPEVFRRNLVVSGINLTALKGRQVAIGTAILELSVICAPCSRMEEALGAGGYSAMRGHGGWCASVVQPGVVRVGSEIHPIE